MNPRTKRQCRYCKAHDVWDRVLYLDASGKVTTYPARVTEMESVICLSCKEVQPLGPANDDDPRVAVEIRAAEIVASFHESNWPFTSWHTTQDENLGWRFDDAAPHTIGYDAGRLARTIATHDEKGEG